MYVRTYVVGGAKRQRTKDTLNESNDFSYHAGRPRRVGPHITSEQRTSVRKSSELKDRAASISLNGEVFQLLKISLIY